MTSLSVFKQILPKDGDWITPSSVNAGSLLNREDIIAKDTCIGDMETLIDEKHIAFSSSEQALKEIDDTKSAVNCINKLKIDMENKYLLATHERNSITNAVNEIHNTMYREARLEGILADYTYQRGGDFIASGLKVTFDTVTTSTKTYQQAYYEQIWIPVRNTFSSTFGHRMGYTKLVRSYKATQPDPIITTNVTIKLQLEAGIAYINGHKVIVPNTMSVTAPYVLNDIDTMIMDKIYLVTRTQAELYADIEWDNEMAYNKGESVTFNGAEYIAINNVGINGLDPVTDVFNWKFVEVIDENKGDIRYNLLQYIHGTTEIDDTGKYFFKFGEVPANSMLLATIIRENGKQPQVVLYDNARAYNMKDIEGLQGRITDLIDNIASVQSTIEFSNATSSRNMYTESFYNDNYRDILLEEETDYPRAESVNGILTPAIIWDTKIIQLEENRTTQIDKESQSIIISQTEFTGSDLVNEYAVSAPSVVLFDMDPTYFIWNVVNNTTTVNNIVDVSKELWDNAYSISTSTSTTKTGESFQTLSQNGSRDLKLDVMKTVSLPQRVFNQNEIVEIRIDGYLVGTYKSNPNGSLDASFTLSGSTTSEKSRWRDTNYRVIAKGKTSGAEAWSTLEIIAQQRVDSFLKTNTTNRNWYYYNADPIAQTFKMTENCYVSAVDVIFDLQSATGADYTYGSNFLLPDNVIFAICETTAGFPNKEKVIYTQNIPATTPMNNAEWYKIEFTEKVKMDAEKVYAFFLACPEKANAKYNDVADFAKNYANSRIKLRTCEVGKKISYAPFVVINEQKYIDGMLLKSSNSSTWTPYQSKDMAFRLYKTTFNGSKNISSSTLTLNTKYTDVYYESEEIVPEGTSISSSLNVLYSDATTQSIRLKEGMFSFFNNKTISSIQPIFSLVTDDTSITPTLYKRPLIHLGNVQSNSVFVTSNIDLNGKDYAVMKNLSVVFDCINGWDSSKIEIYYNENSIIRDDNWTKMTDWVAGDLEGQFIFSKSNVELSQFLRIKIILKVDMDNPFTRIMISKLRVLAI
jgi:hypothetical protein